MRILLAATAVALASAPAYAQARGDYTFINQTAHDLDLTVNTFFGNHFFPDPLLAFSSDTGFAEPSVTNLTGTIRYVNDDGTGCSFQTQVFWNPNPPPGFWTFAINPTAVGDDPEDVICDVQFTSQDPGTGEFEVDLTIGGF
ncbi:hypothetical protein FKB34_16410 [Glycocaulis profundi]|nr:hypothetical protein FKB34_16410 [Glycocaulis profundi]